ISLGEFQWVVQIVAESGEDLGASGFYLLGLAQISQLDDLAQALGSGLEPGDFYMEGGSRKVDFAGTRPEPPPPARAASRMGSMWAPTSRLAVRPWLTDSNR